MATQNQINFVSDIETAAKAVIDQGRKVRHISEILDAAGRTNFELNRIAAALSVKREWTLLDKLAEAFLTVELAPKCVLKAISAMDHREKPESAPEPLVLQPYIEPSENVFEQAEAKPEAKEVQLSFAPIDPQEALAEVLSILGPLSMVHKQRVITCASVYYGVGE